MVRNRSNPGRPRGEQLAGSTPAIPTRSTTCTRRAATFRPGSR